MDKIMKTTDFWCEKHLSDLFLMFIFNDDIHSTLDTYCMSNSSLILNSTSPCRGARMGQSPSCNPAPETVPRDERQCDVKTCLTLSTGKGLGGPCVPVVVTDTRPSVLSLMHRNLWESENTTESISKVQLLLWETLFFSDTAIKYHLSSQYSVFYICLRVDVNGAVLWRRRP